MTFINLRREGERVGGIRQIQKEREGGREGGREGRGRERGREGGREEERRYLTIDSVVGKG